MKLTQIEIIVETSRHSGLLSTLPPPPPTPSQNEHTQHMQYNSTYPDAG